MWAWIWTEHTVLFCFFRFQIFHKSLKSLQVWGALPIEPTALVQEPDSLGSSPSIWVSRLIDLWEPQFPRLQIKDNSQDHPAEGMESI